MTLPRRRQLRQDISSLLHAAPWLKKRKHNNDQTQDRQAALTTGHAQQAAPATGRNTQSIDAAISPVPVTLAFSEDQYPDEDGYDENFPDAGPATDTPSSSGYLSSGVASGTPAKRMETMAMSLDRD
ncbi:uncharacterized protein LDX57_009763 [Aspergillus melleus]|uniref:uncharacterized protein n=1 Tax=Aspergillus melleus TaxID=138277 RepID=UPI001E8E10B6|nr:uncharacterized protein LDX57_009763 [Aspergillus melleus]KAH8432117.1 hypothetical protein LDX57_009763 [Aspergillus melleus]